MITAIVLVQASRGMITELAQTLLELPEVAEVYSVAGEYDTMAEVVPDKLQRLQGVERTTRLMAFTCFSRHDLERLFSIGYEESDEVGEQSG